MDLLEIYMNLTLSADFYIIDKRNNKFNYRAICTYLQKEIITYQDFILFVNEKLKEDKKTFSK